jgi:sugar phosphate isomerase/epimerase
MTGGSCTPSRLKLAVFTDEISQDFARAIQVAEEYRLDGIEVRSVWKNGPHKIPAADVARMKEILSDGSLRVCSIASPFFKCDLHSRREISDHLDILKRCIELGKRFDCTLIRGFAFWRKGPAQDVWQEILDEFQAPLRILEENNAVLGIENESSTYVGTGRSLRRFLDDLDSERVRALWDPANSLADTDEREVPYPDGYRAIQDKLVHVHVKDGHRTPTGIDHTPVGEGEIDYLGQFRALRDDGFQGYCSLETHWRPSKMDREMIDRPGGEKFSEAGEYASRKCLDNILRLVAAV